MNSNRHLVDTKLWQQSLLGLPHWTCPIALLQASRGTELPDQDIWQVPNCVRQQLWGALSGYTPWLATMLGFPSRSL